MGLYDISVKTVEGQEIELSKYRGKVLLIVNTASSCGFTPQYAELEALYRDYDDQGFEILDFPCNQFFNQAKESSEDLVSFCQVKYATSFETFAKIEVNGPNTTPLYRYLKNAKRGVFGKSIKYNFTKFLVDRQGNVLYRYGPWTRPEKLMPTIQTLLKEEMQMDIGNKVKNEAK